MKLQGRELSIESKGEDVALLQKELMQLGFEIADSELKDSLFGETTQKAVIEFQQKNDLKETGAVDELTAARINIAVARLPPPSPVFVVQGQIRQADGTPFVGSVVRAFDRDLRSEEPLGEAITDQNGSYRITYTAERFRRAEKKTADLRVSASNVDGRELASSSILYNAPADVSIDLMVGGGVYRGLSEYELLLADLTPVAQGLSPADWVEDDQHQDFTFLANETGQARGRIMLLTLAHRLASSTDVPPAAYYGLFRQGLPTNLPQLLAAGSRTWRRALEAALRDNIIPMVLHDSLETILETLERMFVQKTLEPQADGQFSLGDLLRASALEPEHHAKFLQLYRNHQGPIQDFWTALRQDPDFSQDGKIEDLQFTLQLALLTQNHAPLLRALRQRADLTSMRGLTRLDLETWKQLIDANTNAEGSNLPPSLPGETRQAKITNYATGIVETLKAAFPTPFVGLRVATAPKINRDLVQRVYALNPQLDFHDPQPDALDWTGISAGDQAQAREALETLRQEIMAFPAFDYQQALASSNGDVPHLYNPVRAQVARVFANLPELDLSAPLEPYLAEHAEAFTGVAEEDIPKVKDQLKAIQRVFQVAPHDEHLHVLLSAGLDSAYGIASIAPDLFQEQFGDALGGTQQALEYHMGAQQILGKNLMIFGAAKQAFNDIPLFAIPTYIGTPEKMPNWINLFGSLDLCDCEHCRSVYSPAAYLVDLLQFLNPKLITPRLRPLNALLARRPDLVHIKLSCENTNTPLPYVDLVNEILEFYVAYGALDAKAARNTEEITANELSVNPQYVIEATYNTLKTAVYPLSLPFDRPLQVARAYLKQLDSSLYELMDAVPANFVAGLDLEQAKAYEYLEISNEEAKILIGVTFGDAPWRLYGYPTDMVSGGPWQQHIARVPEFLKRTTLDYVDLIELVKTRFLNSDKLITLAVPRDADPCDLSNTTLTHLDDADARSLKRFNSFIRLWRKLGWSIHELDVVLAALGASDIDDPLLQKLAAVKHLHQELKLPLERLSSLWSNIDTVGTRPTVENSLYHKLFLNKAVLNPVDAAFVLNADATDLLDANQPIHSPDSAHDHVPTILAALHIHPADWELMNQELNPSNDPALDLKLNLANLSALYRIAVLARALKLSFKDLLTLKHLSGINPFESGLPLPTVAFVELAHKVRGSGFKVAQLDYLYRHEIDPVRNVAPLPEQVLRLARQLHDGLIQIADDNVLTPDPNGDMTRTKLGLLFEKAVGDQAIPLIDGSAIYTAALVSLPAGLEFQGALAKRIVYDKKAQVLRFTGPMTATEQTALLTLSPFGDYQNAINSLWQQPRTFVADVLSIFLTNTAEATQRLIEISSLDQDGKPVLLDVDGNPVGDGSIQIAVTTVIAAKFEYVLQKLLPYVRDALSRSLIKRTIGDALKLESEMTSLLLDKLLASPTNLGQPAMNDLLDLFNSGLSGSYFNDPDLTGVPLTRIDPMIVFDWGTGMPDPAISTNAFSIRWSGRLLAQASEPLTLYVRVEGNVRLWVDGQSLIDQWQPQPNTEFSGTIPLKGGQLYDIVLEYARTGATGLVELRWSSPTKPKEIIPPRNLYPSSTHSSFVTLFTRLHKIALLVNRLGLTEFEVAYLSAHGTDFAGVDPANAANTVPFGLNSLPLATSDFNVALFRQWERLLDLVTLRNSLPTTDVSLFEVFAEATKASPDLTRVLDTLVAASNWDESELAYLTGADGFGLTTQADWASYFKNAITLRLLQASLDLSKRLGISARQLIEWATHAPEANEAKDITKTVKAQYDDETWLVISKPLNDSLRERQRDALVAYVLTMPKILQAGVSDANQLFEYFLIDVDMNACMATSRIKQAISSVQMFIQRCLMNLEKSVSPMAIDAEQWEWMKHYRIWEANRKVFLYPENWIEPELRDDKSPFFKDVQSKLLQNDVTEETVEQAFRDYLEKLDEVARLEICGMHWQAKEPDDHPNTDILHVFGRAANPPYIYYYRRLLVDTSVWTPWEKVNLDIAGDDTGVHLIPVIYHRRLHLFWPIFEEKPDKNQNLTNPEKVESEAHKVWAANHEQQQSEHDNWQAMKAVTVPAIMSAEDFDTTWPEPIVDPEPDYSDSTATVQPARTHLEIKLAYSEYKQNKWTPKQVSSDYVFVPAFQDSAGKWAVPERKAFTFAVSISTDDILNIEVNLSLATIPPLKSELLNRYGVFWMDGCHSKVNTYWYWTSDPQKRDVPVRLYISPDASRVDHMSFVQNANANGMTIETVASASAFMPVSHPVLGETPDQSPFSVVYPPDRQPLGNPYWLGDLYPFFYQDRQRTYCVLLKAVSLPILTFTLPGQADPGTAMIKSAEVDLGFPPNPTFDFTNFSMATGSFADISNSNPIAREQTMGNAETRLLPSSLTESTRNELAVNLRRGVRNFFPCITNPFNFLGNQTTYLPVTGFQFVTFFHPHVCALIKALNQKGVAGLLTLGNQRLTHDLRNETRFHAEYDPTWMVSHDPDYPTEDVDFRHSGAYSLYNWELFFHIPLLIAIKLSQNQRFEEALRWFHYIFNPTDSSKEPAPQRYWKVLPFHDNLHPEKQRIQALLAALNKDDPEIEDQVKQWRENPFNPHLIARLRITAYQKNVVMKYLDNLIAWGDQLFRRETIETINEATQLYVLAANLLGQRPPRIPVRGDENLIPGGLSATYFDHADLTGTAVKRVDPTINFQWASTPPEPAIDSNGNGFSVRWSGKVRPQYTQTYTFYTHTDAGVRLWLGGQLLIDQWHDQPLTEHTATIGLKAGQFYDLQLEYLKNGGNGVAELRWSSPSTAKAIVPPNRLYFKGFATYHQLQPLLDSFSSAIVYMENEFPYSISAPSSGTTVSNYSIVVNAGAANAADCPRPSVTRSPAQASLNIGTTFYFCIPQNDKLLGYWDTVADRLFKIRNCMNIEGIVRQLPLFEPPIDPGLLVRATAMGIDLNSVLNDMNAPLPYHRFNFLVQKAQELCAELKSLGGALLSALEKKDGEELAVLRASHETAMLRLVRDVKNLQLNEANAALEALNKSRKVTEARRDYYRDIVRINPNEQSHMDKLGTAHIFNQHAQAISGAASSAHAVPDFDQGSSGWAGTPVVKARFGGSNIGSGLQQFAAQNNFIAAQHTHEATMASIRGGYDRRWDDWKLQEKLANRELDQIDQQIIAAGIRVDIAQKELDNHDQQIENAETIEAFMHDKYTNEELYTWMVGEVSALYFQSYKLAHDLAKRAERAFRFERGLTDSNFIQFGYWDSLRKGLLAGERLSLDIKRLELAYLEQNKREYEIAKHVSLLLHDSMALIRLKEMGRCEVFLPEALFDADYPGHYMRRIKSVSLTIPCVVGPYTSINCTLTLLSNKTRVKSVGGSTYAESEEEEDDRFVTNFAALQSIATSHAQNDSGMFELNFRDERYLPFEGAGVISRWRIELPLDTNAFDFSTLSDVILHLKYTAREGGEVLKKAARAEMERAIGDAETSPLVRLFNAKHEFPTEWYRFLHPSDPAPNQDFIEKLALDLTSERFPFLFRGKEIEINAVEMFLKLSEDAAKEYSNQLVFDLLKIDTNNNQTSLAMASRFQTSGSPIKSLPYAKAFEEQSESLAKWSFEVKESDIQNLPASLRQSFTANGVNHFRLNPDAIEDIWVLCHYSVQKKTT